MHLCQQPILVLHRLLSAHFSPYESGETYNIDLGSVVPQKGVGSLGVILERFDTMLKL